MDKIRQAVDLARSATRIGSVVDEVHAQRIGSVVDEVTAPRLQSAQNPGFMRVKLDPKHLEANRIVAHATTDARARAFDMLRTQVLQSMEAASWQFLAVTSPTAGCGKTVTAANLALSIARQPERNVLLVDLDMRKPKVAEYLGFKFDRGIMSALDGRASLLETVVEASYGPYSLQVLPNEGCTVGTAEWMASQSMNNLLQAIRREFRSHVVIFDLPPMLVGDDVICFLPKVDSVLLIGGAGMSSVADITECNKHLQTTNVLRFVLNKVTESAGPHYGYY